MSVFFDRLRRLSTDEPLNFDVQSEDCEGLKTWLNAHRPQYGRARWFRRADYAVATGNEKKGWVIVRAEVKRRSQAQSTKSLRADIPTPPLIRGDQQGSDLMRPFHWWTGVLLLVGALVFHAAFPRYLIEVGEFGAIVRVDRWTGTVEGAIFDEISSTRWGKWIAAPMPNAVAFPSDIDPVSFSKYRQLDSRLPRGWEDELVKATQKMQEQQREGQK